MSPVDVHSGQSPVSGFQGTADTHIGHFRKEARGQTSSQVGAVASSTSFEA